MYDYSAFIVSAMKYIDGKIIQIDYRSIDRQQLHNSIHIQIVARVKQLVYMDQTKAYKEIDMIFKTELNEEILRRRK